MAFGVTGGIVGRLRRIEAIVRVSMRGRAIHSERHR
jgi:hypothetical protein